MSDAVNIAPCFFFASAPVRATSSLTCRSRKSSSGSDSRNISARMSSPGRPKVSRSAARRRTAGSSASGRLVMNITAIRRLVQSQAVDPLEEGVEPRLVLVVHVLVGPPRRERVGLVDQQEYRLAPEGIRPGLGLGEGLDDQVGHLADHGPSRVPACSP